MKLKEFLDVCDKELEVDVWRSKDDLFLGEHNGHGECYLAPSFYDCEIVNVLGSGKGNLIDVVIRTQED